MGNIFKNLLYMTLLTIALPTVFLAKPLIAYYFLQFESGDIMIAILLIVLIGYKSFKRGPKFTKNPVSTPLLILLFAVFISLLGAKDRKLGMIFLIFLFEGFVVYLYILTFFTTEDDLKHLIFALFLLAGFYGMYAAFQFFFGRIPIFGGVEVPHVSYSSLVCRVGANVGGPNSLALFITIVLPLIFAFLLGAKSIWRLFLSGLVFSLIMILGVTYSRNGYIAFLVSLFVFVLLLSKKHRNPKFLLIYALGILLLIVAVKNYRPDIFSRFLFIKYFRHDPSALMRLVFWKGSVNGFMSHPFTGIGLSNFVHESYAFNLFIHAHSLYLNVLVELGILGISGLFFLFSKILWELIKIYKKERKGTFLSNINIGLLGAWTAFLSHGIFDSVWVNIGHVREGKYVWVLLGLTILSIKLSTQRLSQNF